MESLGSIRRSAKKRKMAKSQSRDLIGREDQNRSRDPLRANSLDFNIAAIGKSLSNELKFGESTDQSESGNQLTNQKPRIIQSDKHPNPSQSRKSTNQNYGNSGSSIRSSVQRTSGSTSGSYSERYALKTGSNQSRPASLPDFQPYETGSNQSRDKTGSNQSSPAKISNRHRNTD